MLMRRRSVCSESNPCPENSRDNRVASKDGELLVGSDSSDWSLADAILLQIWQRFGLIWFSSDGRLSRRAGELSHIAFKTISAEREV